MANEVASHLADLIAKRPAVRVRCIEGCAEQQGHRETRSETMFVPEHLTSNAYRVLQLSAVANAADIHKAAAAMRRAATLGISEAPDVDVLGAIPRTDATIRAAIGRIENPEQRLLDRLFWFQVTPKVLSAQATKSLMESHGKNPQTVAALAHDKALHLLFSALKSDVDDDGVKVWVQALRSWHRVISDDDYWSLALSLEEWGVFEPPALPSEIDALRADAVRLAAEPFVVSAREALARSDELTVRRISIALEELKDTGLWATHALQEITSPALEQFQNLCIALRNDSLAKIVHQSDATKRNKIACDAALSRFRTEAEPALKKTLDLLSRNNELAEQARESAAACLSGIAADFTWADEFIITEKLLEEALELARGTVSAIRLEHALAEAREAASKMRVFGGLKPIASAPALHTFNGFGFTIYGRSDFDADTKSYVTTHYFVALFIPVFPIARYRVIDAGNSSYRFLGKLPLRTLDRWHLGISIAVIAGVILNIVISSNQSANPSATRYSAPRASPSTYSVPSFQSSELASLKAQIESGRSRHTMIKIKLEPISTELTSLNNHLESLKAGLAALDRQKGAGLQIDIDDYNAKVDSHNTILERRRDLLTANRNDIEILENLAAQDSILVDKYNALLKR